MIDAATVDTLKKIALNHGFGPERFAVTGITGEA
jgi:hypothetical protein